MKMEWMLMPLKRYADFQGRSRRTEYWMFVLGVAIVEIAIVGLFALLGAFSIGEDFRPSPLFWPFLIVLGLFGLAIFLPSLAVQIRRFHDQDKSGWMILLGLIPYLGGIILLVFMCLPGTKGPNRFGPDPLGGAGELPKTFE
jgi:uncharacterized membrane protein YhaH (DUF805 family)